jgi:DNA modification methylase
MQMRPDGTIEQLALEGFETDVVAENNHSSFSDPAFASNKTSFVHRWVPWIAGFSSEFVGEAFAKYVRGRATIVDPFAGVGTTLVEALLSGHDAIGFEINPYAAFACRVKTSAYRLDLHQLQKETSHLTTFYRQARSNGYVIRSTPPEGFNSRAPFYSPAVLEKVLLYLDFIETLENSDLADLFRLAFASTMVSYSNYSYEPSLGRRVSAGKSEIEDYPVIETIIGKLRDMAQDIAWMQASMPDAEVSCRVINQSFFDCKDHVEQAVADLLVTSPPYLNNYHYNRNTRPHLYWLDFVQKPQDLKPLEELNFGKFWQTVRDVPRLDLEFSLPNSDLEDRLDALRTLNTHKGVYGGNGWANYAAAYFNDCLRFTKGIQHVLKPGGTALVVIGNSILQGVMIATDRYFAEIAQLAGLELVEIHIPRETRVGNSIIQSKVRVAKAKANHHLYEAIVELRKP